MQWFVAEKNKTFYRVTTAGLLGVLFSIGFTHSVAAVGSQIGVNVCGQNTPGAVITITEPITDSVVNQSLISFRGTVNNASQIEIDVDGQYSGTVAIGANQTSFSTNVTLSQGTHTIAMSANDICGGVDANDSVVITYTPEATKPSNGVTTPTEIDQQQTADTTVSTDTPLAKNDFLHQVEQVPVLGTAFNAVADFAAATGLIATVQNTSVVSGVSRVGLTVAAITSVVMASSIAPVAAQALPGLTQVFGAVSPRSLLYMGWAIRGVGILIMTLAYFL
jgi:hypothetical protein